MTANIAVSNSLPNDRSRFAGKVVAIYTDHFRFVKEN